jgi:hypothetical protein
VAKITLTPLPKEEKAPVIKEKVRSGGIVIEPLGPSKKDALSLREYLWEEADSKDCFLYAIFDSARNDEIFRFLATDEVRYKSLFEGTMDIKSFGVSGFLIECKKKSVIYNWLTSDAWGDNSMIFFTSKADLNDLLTHFQKFNRVFVEGDDVVLFRYYDPRVLRIFLPSCTMHEIDLFFGEVDSFYTEGDDPEFINIFRKGQATESDGLLVSGIKVKTD